MDEQTLSIYDFVTQIVSEEKDRIRIKRINIILEGFDKQSKSKRTVQHEWFTAAKELEEYSLYRD